MFRKIFLLSVFLVPALFSAAAELDDFEQDFEYLYKNKDLVSRLSADDPYLPEYRNRMTKTAALAAKIQSVATEIGIRDITVQADFSAMCQFIRIGRSISATKKTSGSASFHAENVRRQIRLLHSLNFSCENKMFTRPEHFGDQDLDVLNTFEKLLKQCSKLAAAEKYPSDAIIAKNDELYFEKLSTMAQEIGQRVLLEKVRVPSEFRIALNVHIFRDNYAARLSIYRSFQSIRGNSKKRASKLKQLNTDFKLSKEKLELSSRRVEEDVQSLRKAGFVMLASAPAPFAPMRTAGTAPRATESVAPNYGGISKDELFRRYSEIREKAYAAESRLNGVSVQYYSSYRGILPARQAEELDLLRDKFLQEQYLPQFAREMAVSRIHNKYKTSIESYSAGELDSLTRQTGGTSK